MLDLEQAAATDWFRTVHLAESDWPPPVRSVEMSGDAPALLTQLGDLLSRHGHEQPERLAALLAAPNMLGPMQRALAQLGAARLLRILSWLSQCGIPDTSLLVARLTEGPSAEARTLRAALAAIGREELLNRLFAGDRVAALAAAARTTKEEQN